MAVIEAIETVYLEADAASVTFSSLGSYEHLQLRMNLRTLRASNYETVGIRLNGDTANNYSTHRMYGTDTSTAAGPETATDRALAAGQMVTTTMDPRTVYGSAIVDILDYRNASKNTTLMFFSANVGTSKDPYVTFGSGLWDATTAVSTILLYPANGSAGFVRGSVFTLYGLKSS